MIVILALIMIVYMGIQVYLAYRSSNVASKVQAEEKKLNSLKQEYKDSVNFLNELKKEVK